MFTLHRNFRLIGVLIFILLPAAALPAAAGDDLPDLGQILDRYIEVMGGRKAMEKLETRVIVGMEIDDRPYKGPPVESKLEVWANAAGDWTMSLHGPDSEWREGRSSGESWIKKPGQEIETQEYRNTKLAFLFNPRGPLQVEKYFPNLKLTGTWDYDGVEYYKVENDLKLEYYTLYFEVETGMLTRIGYHWKLEGFREIDGVLVPAKVMQGRKGGSTNLYFDDVAHGADVAEHLRPGGK
ncbi:MAG: hypothetical protein ABFS42_12660 [Candidatus Krumholzibacteriota bacterium]